MSTAHKALSYSPKMTGRPVEFVTGAGSITDYDMMFKFLLVGDSGVGKSSLLLRFADDIYQDSYISTIGVDMRIRTILIDGVRVKLQIWDTAGQERFKTICQQYYRGAHAVVVAFDLTEKQSFLNVGNWMEEVQLHTREDCKRLLVGNKCDALSKRQVSKLDALELSTRCGYDYLETSSKTSENVDKVFMSLATDLSKRTWPKDSGYVFPSLNNTPITDASQTKSCPCSIM